MQWHEHDRVQDFTFLTQFTQESHLLGHSQSKDTVEKGLLAYAAEGRLPKLIAFVRGFASSHSVQSASAQILATSARTSKLEPHVEYPKHVSQQLYQTLLKYSTCECPAHDTPAGPGERKRHLPSRLRLRDSRIIKDKWICFDMAFSPATTSSVALSRVDWQHMQFRIRR